MHSGERGDASLARRLGPCIGLVLVAAGCVGGPDASAQAEAEAEAGAAAARCPTGSEPSELDGVAACVEEVSFRSGELALGGQWFRPPGGGPHPAVVVIRGSGDSRRGNAWTESLTAVLVGEEVGVLVPDKRGSDGSEGDWRRVGFEELADDALAGVRFLAGRPDVVADRIGLMGLSQGGQVAPVAAARSDSVAFVIDVVGAAVPFVRNIRFEMRNAFREEGLSGPELDAAMRMVDTAVGRVRGSVSWPAYEAALREAREALGSEIVDAYFIASPDHWRWDFFRRLADFDPVEWWVRVEQPTLVLLGGEDRNTPASESARRLRDAFEESGPEDATVVVFDGLGHDLYDHAAPGPMSEHGLHADVRRTLAEWVRRVGWEGRSAPEAAR